MSGRRAFRCGLALLGLLGALSTGVSCYRAEVDLAPLLDDAPSGGGGVASSGSAGMAASVAGERGGDGGETSAGGEPTAAGAGGVPSAPECDPTPEDPVQTECRRRPPSKLVCDEQASPGWAGCYNGGCAICLEVLADYPYYLSRHPCCVVNTTCGVHSPLKCSPLCPPPTELDTKPLCYELAR